MVEGQGTVNRQRAVLKEGLRFRVDEIGDEVGVRRTMEVGEAARISVDSIVREGYPDPVGTDSSLMNLPADALSRPRSEPAAGRLRASALR